MTRSDNSAAEPANRDRAAARQSAQAAMHDARQFVKRGRPSEAAQCLGDGIAALDRVGDSVNAALMRRDLGGALSAMGLDGPAIEALTEAYDVLRIAATAPGASFRTRAAVVDTALERADLLRNIGLASEASDALDDLTRFVGRVELDGATAKVFLRAAEQRIKSSDLTSASEAIQIGAAAADRAEDAFLRLVAVSVQADLDLASPTEDAITALLEWAATKAQTGMRFADLSASSPGYRDAGGQAVEHLVAASMGFRRAGHPAGSHRALELIAELFERSDLAASDVPDARLRALAVAEEAELDLEYTAKGDLARRLQPEQIDRPLIGGLASRAPLHVETSTLLRDASELAERGSSAEAARCARAAWRLARSAGDMSAMLNAVLVQADIEWRLTGPRELGIDRALALLAAATGAFRRVSGCEFHLASLELASEVIEWWTDSTRTRSERFPLRYVLSISDGDMILNSRVPGPAGAVHLVFHDGTEATVDAADLELLGIKQPLRADVSAGETLALLGIPLGPDVLTSRRVVAIDPTLPSVLALATVAAVRIAHTAPVAVGPYAMYTKALLALQQASALNDLGSLVTEAEREQAWRQARLLFRMTEASGLDTPPSVQADWFESECGLSTAGVDAIREVVQFHITANEEPRLTRDTDEPVTPTKSASVVEAVAESIAAAAASRRGTPELWDQAAAKWTSLSRSNEQICKSLARRASSDSTDPARIVGSALGPAAFAALASAARQTPIRTWDALTIDSTVQRRPLDRTPEYDPPRRSIPAASRYPTRERILHHPSVADWRTQEEQSLRSANVPTMKRIVRRSKRRNRP